MPEHHQVDYTQALLLLLYIFIGVTCFIVLILICRRQEQRSKTSLWKSFIKELGYRDPESTTRDELSCLAPNRHSNLTQLGRFSTAGWSTRGSYNISLKSKTSSRGPSIVITESDDSNRISIVPNPDITIDIGIDGVQQNLHRDSSASSSSNASNQFLQVPLMDIFEEEEENDQTPLSNPSK